MAISIVPLRLGLVEMERSVLTYGRGFGERVVVPLIAYLVRDDSALILVDTGPPAPEWCERHLRPIAQTPAESLERALTAASIEPRDVDAVVFTHLHWDHCGAADVVPGATLIAQRAELAYAQEPLTIHVMSYQAPASGLPPLVDPARLSSVDGDHRLTPGVQLLHTPGHSPGSQCVLVTCDRARYLIAGDTVPLYDNLQPFSKYASVTPTGIYIDLRDCMESLRRIQDTRATVLPGHDAAVLRCSEYR